MGKKDYNSPERIKNRDEGYRIFSNKREPTKEEQIKDMEAYQEGISKTFMKETKEQKEDRLIEGHRLIRNFKREERKEEIIEVKDFKRKELGLVEKDLLETIEDLKELLKVSDEIKQKDIIEDLPLLKFYISKCVDIEKGVNIVNEKYGWNK